MRRRREGCGEGAQWDPRHGRVCVSCRCIGEQVVLVCSIQHFQIPETGRNFFLAESVGSHIHHRTVKLFC